MIFGRILELLYAVDPSKEISQTKVVSVDEFVLGERLHPDLQCPVLRRPITNSNVVLLDPSVCFHFL